MQISFEWKLGQNHEEIKGNVGQKTTKYFLLTLKFVISNLNRKIQLQ
jgi:hypothetical protein